MLPHVQSPKRSRKRRGWRVTIGGNQLASRLKRELVGDHNVTDALPPDHPRRKPTLPTLNFLRADEEVS
jgi:hypothetical protein